MFKFFRSIRQGLVNEGKTSKYLKYALGEFILVVLGILVALQINNWNERRKGEEQRLVLIANLKADMQENLGFVQQMIKRGEESKESLATFLKSARGDSSQVPVNELGALLELGSRPFRFELNLPSYEVAVSTGSLGLIESTELNKYFIQLRQTDAQLKRITDLTNEVFLTGSQVELHKELGSRQILYPQRQSGYEQFRITEDEYREFIARKDVYATYEQMERFVGIKLGRMKDMKEIMTQVLETLESLN